MGECPSGRIELFKRFKIVSMKKIQIITAFILLISSHNSYSQTTNWKNLKREEKHLLNINAGWEYSFVYGLNYGYHFDIKLPIIAEISFSFPSGETLFDDFKTKIGGQVNLYKIDDFYFNASVHGIYRRYENPLAQLQNFGADANGIIGYYKTKWFVAAEFGFDKAIVTHLNHTSIYKEAYPEVKNGWYEPTTGGNFNYGLQGGYSFKRSDLTLRVGKVITEDFKTEPLIPFYLQLGYNWKLN